MAIAIALLGFNDLGRSVTPTFLFQKQILFTITSTPSKFEQKINVGSSKNFKISVHGTSNPAILLLQGA